MCLEVGYADLPWQLVRLAAKHETKGFLIARDKQTPVDILGREGLHIMHTGTVPCPDGWVPDFVEPKN